jgi:hypothetical protein
MGCGASSGGEAAAAAPVYKEPTEYKFLPFATANGILALAGTGASKGGPHESMKAAIKKLSTQSAVGVAPMVEKVCTAGPTDDLTPGKVKTWTCKTEQHFTFVCIMDDIDATINEMKVIIWDRFNDRRNALGQTAREILSVAAQEKLFHVMKVKTPASRASQKVEDQAFAGRVWNDGDTMAMVLLPVESSHIPEETGFQRGTSVVGWYVEPKPGEGGAKLRATYFSSYEWKEGISEVNLSGYTEANLQGKLREMDMFVDQSHTLGKRASVAVAPKVNMGVDYEFTDSCKITGLDILSQLPPQQNAHIACKDSLVQLCKSEGQGPLFLETLQAVRDGPKAAGARTKISVTKTHYTYITIFDELSCGMAEMKKLLWDRFVQRRNALGQTAREVKVLATDEKIFHVMQMKTPISRAKKTTEDNAFTAKLFEDAEGALVMVLLPCITRHIPNEKGFMRGEGLVAWHVKPFADDPSKCRAVYFADYGLVPEVTPEVLAQFAEAALKGKVKEMEMFNQKEVKDEAAAKAIAEE